MLTYFNNNIAPQNDDLGKSLEEHEYHSRFDDNHIKDCKDCRDLAWDFQFEPEFEEAY